MQIRQLLKDRNLYSVQKDQSVLDVARTMAFLGVGAIVVLDGRALSGIFSERDLMRRVIVEERDPATTAVADVMTTDLATIDELELCEDAIALMQRFRCRHLPVLSNGDVVGLVSMRDIMADQLEQKSTELEHMRNYIQASA